MVVLKSNAHATKQENAPNRRSRKDTNQSFNVSRRVKFIEARRRTSDGLKSFADTLANSQRKITHTLLLSARTRYEKGGNEVSTAKRTHSSSAITTRLSCSIAKVSLRCRKGSSRGWTPPDLQVRQRQGQQIQRYKDPDTDHAATEKSDQASRGAGQPVACPVDQGSGRINWWQFCNFW